MASIFCPPSPTMEHFGSHRWWRVEWGGQTWALNEALSPALPFSWCTCYITGMAFVLPWDIFLSTSASHLCLVPAWCIPEAPSTGSAPPSGWIDQGVSPCEIPGSFDFTLSSITYWGYNIFFMTVNHPYQWFSAMDDFAPMRHLTIPTDNFYYHNGKEEGDTGSRKSSTILLNTLLFTGQFLFLQIIIGSKCQ